MGGFRENRIGWCVGIKVRLSGVWVVGGATKKHFLKLGLIMTYIVLPH